MMASVVPTVVVVGTGSIGSRHMDVFSRLGARVIAIPRRRERRIELEREEVNILRGLLNALQGPKSK